MYATAMTAEIKPNASGKLFPAWLWASKAAVSPTETKPLPNNPPTNETRFGPRTSSLGRPNTGRSEISVVRHNKIEFTDRGTLPLRRGIQDNHRLHRSFPRHEEGINLNVSTSTNNTDCCTSSKRQLSQHRHVAVDHGAPVSRTRSDAINLGVGHATTVKAARPKLVIVSRPCFRTPSSRLTSPPDTPATFQPSIFDQPSPVTSFGEVSSSEGSVSDMCATKSTKRPEDKGFSYTPHVSSPSADTASTFGSKVSRKFSVSLRRLRGRPASSKGPSSPATEASYPPSPAVSESPLISPMSQKSTEHARTHTFWDMGWVLDRLEESLRSYPDGALTLSSPVILFIRSNPERVLLEPLRAIFYDAPGHLLDIFCAIVIASNYLLASLKRNTPSINPTAPHECLDNLEDIPRKSNKRLGFRLSITSQLHVKDQIMQTRITNVQQRLSDVIDQLMISLCGKSNDLLRLSVFVLIDALEKKGGNHIDTR